MLIVTTEFDSCCGGGKGPSNLNGGLVTLGLPGKSLSRQFLLGRDAAVQTLADQHGEFDFGHVEPTAVLGGKVKVELVLELMRPLCREMFIK